VIAQEDDMTVSANRTQECEETAGRCFEIAITRFQGQVRAAYLTWRDGRAAGASDAEDTAKANTFYESLLSLTNDWLMPFNWLSPHPQAPNVVYSALGNGWNGQRCVSGAATCQPSGPSGQGYVPDPGTGGEGSFGGDPINPPYGAGEGPQPSTNVQCYVDGALVGQLAALQKNAYDAVVAFSVRHYDVYPTRYRLPTAEEFNALVVPFQAIYDMYVNLWFNTYCGDPTPAPLTPQGLHLVWQQLP
jgi:hypothetical protein